MSTYTLHKAIAGTGAAVALGLVLGALVGAAENPANDCLIGVQDANSQTIAGDVSCTDGDPSCDVDGATNGACSIKIRGCINIPGVSGCALRPIKKFKFNVQKQKTLITSTLTNPTPADSVCGAFVNLAVPLKKKGKKPGKIKIVSNVKADVKPQGQNKDKDVNKFICNPCPTADCSGGGTTTTTLPVGVECPANPDGGPSQLTLTVGPGGGDLDTGFSGQSHNFINVPNSQLKYCLTGCNGTSDTSCVGSAPTGTGTINGPAFGPPLPLFSAGVAVCVVNRFHDPTIDTIVDLATGSFNAQATPLNLSSDTYQGNSAQVCPKCVNNKCDSGRRQGQNCTVGGTVIVNNPPNTINQSYPVSADCLPAQANLLGTPEVALGLTTDTSTLAGNAAGTLPCPGQAKHDECGGGQQCNVDCSSKVDPKGGINQTCCTNAAGTPCFPTNPTSGIGQIQRTGNTEVPTPALPDQTFPKTSQGTMAAVFCIPPTTNTAVDATAGLAGPGALLLPGTATWAK